MMMMMFQCNCFATNNTLIAPFWWKKNISSRYSFFFFANQIFYQVVRWFYWIFNIKLLFVYFIQRKTYHAYVFVLKLLISVTQLLLYDLKKNDFFFQLNSWKFMSCSNSTSTIQCHIKQFEQNWVWNTEATKYNLDKKEFA